MERWHWLVSLGTAPFSRRCAGGTTGHLVELEGSDLESVNLRGRVQGVKVLVGTGVPLPSKARSSAGKRVRSLQEGAGQWWGAEWGPAPLLAGVEVRHGCPSSRVTVRSHLALGSESEGFCQIQLCIF